ncbi:MAG: flagellin, partial [bacterium]|nr:flagellin [bacterium]
LIMVTFGNINAQTTLSQALNLDDTATLTFTLTLGTNAVVVTFSETATIGTLVASLGSALNTYGVNVVFDDNNDTIRFLYSNTSTRVTDYSVTAGSVTIGTLGTEINYTVGVLTFTLTLGNNQTILFTSASDVTVNSFVNQLNSLLTGYGLSVTSTFDDTNNAIVFNYQAGSTKIETFGVTSGGTLTYSVVGAFNATDKVSADSIDVTILVTDPVTNIGRTVTSTSREFAAGTGGPNVSVDSSGISGVTFKLTSSAASTTGTYFTFDLSKGSITLQIGPNAGTDHRMEITINDMSSNALGVANINVTSQASAQAIIDARTIDKAIELVVTERGKLGAYENRLNHTIQNLGVAKENLTSAESRLRDADLAAEMMEFTRNQIMLQAGTAMLAQANTVPQTVLQLLR